LPVAYRVLGRRVLPRLGAPSASVPPAGMPLYWPRGWRWACSSPARFSLARSVLRRGCHCASACRPRPPARSASVAGAAPDGLPSRPLRACKARGSLSALPPPFVVTGLFGPGAPFPPRGLPAPRVPAAPGGRVLPLLGALCRLAALCRQRRLVARSLRRVSARSPPPRWLAGPARPTWCPPLPRPGVPARGRRCLLFASPFPADGPRAFARGHPRLPGRASVWVPRHPPWLRVPAPPLPVSRVAPASRTGLPRCRACLLRPSEPARRPPAACAPRRHTGVGCCLPAASHGFPVRQAPVLLLGPPPRSPAGAAAAGALPGAPVAPRPAVPADPRSCPASAAPGSAELAAVARSPCGWCCRCLARHRCSHRMAVPRPGCQRPPHGCGRMAPRPPCGRGSGVSWACLRHQSIRLLGWRCCGRSPASFHAATHSARPPRPVRLVAWACAVAPLSVVACRGVRLGFVSSLVFS